MTKPAARHRAPAPDGAPGEHRAPARDGAHAGHRAPAGRRAPARPGARLVLLLAVSVVLAGLLGVDRRAVADNAGYLDTVAGSVGVGTATSIAVNPRGVAVSGTSLYIADLANDVVRKVDLGTGAATVVAGNAVAGYSGDGGPATVAQLSDPNDVAVDGSGNVYIADTSNHRIRKVTVGTGVITTVAGNGTAGNTGDGAAATAARLSSPRGVAVDTSGNLYISDSGNTRLRKVTIATGFISLLASGLGAPRGLTVDSVNGFVYLADAGTHRVLRFSATTPGAATIVAGSTSGFSGDGGAATSAQLNSPTGVEHDGSGTVYVTDTNNHRVRRFTVGGTISTVVGSSSTAGLAGDGGLATAAAVRLTSPTDVTLDGSANLYFGQYSTSTFTPYDSAVRKVDGAQIISTVAGNGWVSFSGDGGPATSAQVNQPAGVAVDPAGNVYFADSMNHRVRRISAGGVVTTVAGTGVACACATAVLGDGGQATSASLSSPMAVALDSTGGILYISDYNHHRVRKLVLATGVITTFAGNGSAGFLGDGAAATSARLYQPLGLSVAPDGTVYVADTVNSRIRRIDTSGIITTVVGASSGTTADGSAATSTMLAGPLDVKVGPDGGLYISEYAGHRVRVVRNGIVGTVAGTGTAGYTGDGGSATSARLNQPAALTFDPWGNLYIGEYTNHIVRRVDRNGIVATVAGTQGSSGGYSGDGGPGTSGRLVQPGGLGFDPAGNLFIADYFSQRIRRLVKSTGMATWWASDSTTSHANSTYSWEFQTQVNAQIAKVTTTVPAGTAGTPVLADVYGLPTGGTLSLVGTTVTYTLPYPVTVDAKVKAYVTATGFTNTPTPGDYGSTVTTYDGSNTPIDTSYAGTLAFAASANALRPVPARAAGLSNSATSQSFLLDPSSATLRDRTAATTLTIGVNAPRGYMLRARATPVTGSKGTIAQITSGVAVPVAPAAFLTNTFGYTASTVTGTAVGVRQWGLASNAYVGYTPSGEAVLVGPAAAAGDVVTFTNRAKIDYLTPAGTYTTTITYTLVPAYS